MKFILFVTLLFSSSLMSMEMTLKGRTISDQCTYIYHLETDFVFEVKASNLGDDPVLNFTFQDVYTGEYAQTKDVSLKQIDDETWRVEFSEVTFSNRHHYLYHQMSLEFNGITMNTEIKGLRNRCYPGGRQQTPFQYLVLQ